MGYTLFALHCIIQSRRAVTQHVAVETDGFLQTICI